MAEEIKEVKEPKEAKKKPGKARTFFSRIGKFFRDIKSEIKKITWPAVPTVFRNMGITLLFIVIIGAFVFLLDFGFSNLLGLIMQTGG